MEKMFLLRCAVKSYEWGRIGMNSTVAQLSVSSNLDFKVNSSTPYSEMWMGTHPSGPSVIPSLGNIELLEWINQNPGSLGVKVQQQFGYESGLPFLFKVLSVNKALSIQVHPDKPTAEQLRRKFPEHYPDDNHKPEMAIALTEFEALCGFRPMEEIKSMVKELHQLQVVIGKNKVASLLNSDDRSTFKDVFTALVTAKEEVFKPQLGDLVHTFETSESLPEICKPIRDVFLRIHHEYPGDIGCLSLFFLNYIVLNPGEAIYLAANEPHAYLLGDCVECMACSDNVVRAGLTPKFRDVNTLCEILSYNCKSAKDNMFPSVLEATDSCIKVYDPPVKEFSVAKIEVPMQSAFYTLANLDSASILLVVEGDASAVTDLQCSESGIPLSRGSVLFICSGVSVYLKVSSRLLLFRAYSTV